VNGNGFSVNVIQGLAAVVGSLLVALLLVEIGLRLIGYSRPVFYRYDETLGADLRSDVAGYYKKEDLIYISLNEDGLRGLRRSHTKPDSTLRIAVLGDSFTEGFQVTYDNLFTTILQQELAKCVSDDLRVEVLNFGVSGFGTAREIFKYRKHARSYDPDLVLLMFYPGNDYRNNHPLLEQNPFLPYFVIRDGTLVEDTSFRSLPAFRKKLKFSNPRNEIVNVSRALQLANEVLVAWMAGGLLGRITNQPEISEPAALPYIHPDDEVWKEAIAATDAMLNSLAEEVQFDERRFVLSSVVPSSGVHTNQSVREAWDSAQRGDGFAGAENRLRRLAQSGGYEFVGLLEPMRRYVEKTGEDLFYFEYLGRAGGHWNKIGHRVAGMALADRLCPVLIEHGAAS